MNRTIISGRLGKDIELKRTQTGKVVVNFDLAVYKSQDATDWIPIVAWEKTAERLAMSKKGDIIEIDGSITTRTYQNKEGVVQESVSRRDCVPSRCERHREVFC